MMISRRFFNFIKKFSLVCFCVLKEAVVGSMTSDISVVRTSTVTIRGKLIKTPTTSYYAFKGIPYAEPPIGSLRFEPPVRRKTWAGVRDSLENEKRCLSLGGISKKFQIVHGSEDCLYLNIYVPSTKSFLMRAVMFFISGNIFTTEQEYGPEYLVKHNVIVVTLSYRNSVFGFLSNEDEELSGNQGLKDIVMALRWIQINIVKFIGNPRRVTIFGQSDGAAMANYLMISPSTRGLFSKVILQSGSALMPHIFQPNPRKIFQTLINKLGINYTSTKEMLEKLKAIDAEKLFSVMAITNNIVNPFLLRPLDFVPCIEPKFSNNPFLTESPITTMINGRFQIIPVMVGSNIHEAHFLNKTLMNLTKTYNNFPHFIVPISFELSENSIRMNETIKDLRKFYFKGRENGTNDEWLQVYTDQLFKFPVDRFVRFFAAKSHLKIFYYEFAFDGNINYFKNLFDLFTTSTISTHSDEISYLFEIKSMKLTPDIKAGIVRERMTALWTNFAKDGNPTMRSSALLKTVWFRYKTYSRHIYEIGETPSNRQSFARMDKLSFLQRRSTGHF